MVWNLDISNCDISSGWVSSWYFWAFEKLDGPWIQKRAFDQTTFWSVQFYDRLFWLTSTLRSVHSDNHPLGGPSILMNVHFEDRLLWGPSRNPFSSTQSTAIFWQIGQILWYVFSMWHILLFWQLQNSNRYPMTNRPTGHYILFKLYMKFHSHQAY